MNRFCTYIEPFAVDVEEDKADDDKEEGTIESGGPTQAQLGPCGV